MITPLHRLSLLMTISLFLPTLRSQAQSECTVTLDEVDPFTKERVVCVASAAPPIGPLFRWHAMNRDKSLQITWSGPNNTQLVVLQGDALYLLLENDSVLALPSATTEVGDFKLDEQGRPCYSGTYTFAMSDSVLKVLQTNWVSRLRLHHTTGYQDFAAEQIPDWQHGLVTTLDCFLATCAERPLPPNAVVGQKVAPASGMRQ